LDFVEGSGFLSAAGILECVSAMSNLPCDVESSQKEKAESNLARRACIKSCDAMERMRNTSVVERYPAEPSCLSA